MSFTPPRPGYNAELGALFALVAASTQSTRQMYANPASKGVCVTIDITAISGAGANLIVTIEALDPVSGKFMPILASAALTAVGTTSLTVYPGAGAAANVVQNAHLTTNWDIKIDIAGTTPSVTATISAQLLG